MDIILSTILSVVGLAIFEIVCSLDNAVINAQIIATMTARGRRFFLTWGLFVGVFLVRGLLPWVIVWAVVPGVGPIDALTLAFSGDARVKAAVESAAPGLLAAGGTFLILLFQDWLFREEKVFGLPHEPFFHRHKTWFYVTAMVTLTTMTWKAVHIAPLLAFGLMVGATAFFITAGFKEQAEEAEKDLASGGKNDIAKVIYLEIIDATFSVDGVVGAFAFTMSVPIILIGNGIGAIVVRQLTMANVERIKELRYMKNGAMYAVLVLGGAMVSEAFGAHVPGWFSPLATVGIVATAFVASLRARKTGVRSVVPEA